MKKTIFTLAITTLVTGTLLNGCKSSTKKEENVQKTSKEVKEEFNTAKDDAEQKEIDAEEWKAFRNESEAKIKNNEERITELKAKMKKPGKKFDEVYAKKIDKLEQKNKNMKTRIETYETIKSEWQSFKREFNHDMDELGQALKDFAVNNKN